jgi:hypothetical protein
VVGQAVTIVAFQPNNSASPPFQTLVVLDGVSYFMSTMWNTYSGRWYVQLNDQNGNLIANKALIGSPPNADIPLFPNQFITSVVVYRVSTNNFEITP